MGLDGDPWGADGARSHDPEILAKTKSWTLNQLHHSGAPKIPSKIKTKNSFCANMDSLSIFIKSVCLRYGRLIYIKTRRTWKLPYPL